MSQNEISPQICGLEFRHPLICPPVLQHIFNNLELKDLKICRLVCEHWSVNSLVQMKSRRNRINLTSNVSFIQFLNNETGFTEFQRFKFTYSMESEPNLIEFMNTSKIQNKNITFVIGKGDTTDLNLIDKFLSFLAEDSEHLESFGIEIRQESTQVPPTMDFGSFEINWTKCKSLALWYVKDHPIFLAILERASQLERLEIIDGPPYSAYRPFLENLVPTLIELVMSEKFACQKMERIYSSFLRGLNDNNDKLPPFTKLNTLKITRERSSGHCYDMTIPSLPELTELFLEFDYFIARPRFERLAIFPKLKSLDMNFRINEEDFKKFPYMFPNLKRFQTNHYGVTDVWQYLKMIEEFNCSFPYLEDKGIIGFDPDLSPVAVAVHPESNNFYHNKKYADWSDIYKRERGKCSKNENNQSTRGIQVLSELKRLRLHVDQVSNASIIFGILKCKSLRTVQFVSPCRYLTKEILKWMADELNLLSLSIEVYHEEWLSCDETIYFVQKHPNCQLVLDYYPTQFSYRSNQKERLLGGLKQ